MDTLTVTQPCAGCGGRAAASNIDLCHACDARGLRQCDLCGEFDVLHQATIDGQRASACAACIGTASCENCGSTTGVTSTEIRNERGERWSERLCSACQPSAVAA